MKKTIFLILIFMCGCVSAEEMRGLLTLKSLADNQAQQDKFVKTQEDRFQKLLKYIKNNKLKEGRSKRWVLAAFGEPYLTKEIEDDPIKVESIMYRHPDKFFGSEKVYLYFDEDNALVGWRYEEAL